MKTFPCSIFSAFRCNILPGHCLLYFQKLEIILAISLMILGEISSLSDDTPIEVVYRCPRISAIKFFINTIHEINIAM